MTPTTRLLDQKLGLFRRAVEQTCDVNEAYLLVHRVMSRGLSRVTELDQDLGIALTDALETRRRRLDTVKAVA
jgi:hypothetical protein